MNFKSFFFALLVAASFTIAGSYSDATAKATSLSASYSLSEDDYIYVYQNLDGVMWVFVYDKGGNLITAYPED